MRSGGMIDIRDLGRRFGRREAITGVSFQVAEGETLGFLGSNGAANPTTINLLSTLLRPTGGTASINGSERASIAPRSAASRADRVSVFSPETILRLLKHCHKNSM